MVPPQAGVKVEADEANGAVIDNGESGERGEIGVRGEPTDESDGPASEGVNSGVNTSRSTLTLHSSGP